MLIKKIELRTIQEELNNNLNFLEYALQGRQARDEDNPKEFTYLHKDKLEQALLALKSTISKIESNLITG